MLNKKKKKIIKLPSQLIITTKGPYFYGDLIKGELLERVAKQKAKEYREEKIHKAFRKKYLSKEWFIQKELKNHIIVRKNKKIDELLENEVWLLFKHLGFTEMNKDRKFKIQADPSPKQIDIFAKDNNNVFVVFCTSKKKETPCKELRGKIHEILNLKEPITESIKKHYNKDFKVSFFLITKNIIWNSKDEEFASKNQLFFWKESDLEAYKNIAEQLGPAAKYQMYSLLFGDKKVLEVGKIEVPAMYGGIGKDKYYCFLIQPEKLFKIAYVHRREKSKPKEVRSAYQRMVNKKRLEKIAEFIDKGNSFPNNIIISFKRKPEFKPFEHQYHKSDITYGILKFPSYYGCAWVIDGQHRLYGYSKSKHALDHTIPVIAFESKSVKNQANLFVDINQEQKSVNQNLLWDLYPDIYYDSKDEEQQILRAISLVAKKLNSDKDSVFYNLIQIPSILIKKKKKINLTLTNICDGIKDNRLINREEVLLFKENYEKSVNFAAKTIRTYFEIVISSLINDWEKGEKGLLRTNVGIRIFFIIFRQLLRYFSYKGKENIYRKKDLTEFKIETRNILTPIFDELCKKSQQEIDEIRGGSTKNLVIKNAQKLLWDMKEDLGFGLELWNYKNAWNPGIPKTETDDKIIELIDDTEIKLRAMMIEILRGKYKENWWKQGIPGVIKDKINEVIEKDISKFPWKRKEIESLSEEEKIRFSLTSHLKEVIINRGNWKYFEEIFYKYQECAIVQFSFFENFRNKYKHPERRLYLDEVEKGLGYYGMGWIRKCIGLNPKKVT